MTDHIHNSLRNHAVGMIVLSTIQYLLGEFTSLFIQFPNTKQNRTLWSFTWQQIPLVLHIIIGTVLFFGTIALMIRSVIYKDRVWIIASFTAGISVLGAALAGITFIPTQTDTYSFIMALYFLIALFSYFWGLYQSAEGQRKDLDEQIVGHSQLSKVVHNKRRKKNK